MIVLHLHPVFADVFPIFGESHSCDQLLFGNSGGLLDGLIDQLDKLLLVYLVTGTVNLKMKKDLTRDFFYEIIHIVELIQR